MGYPWGNSDYIPEGNRLYLEIELGIRLVHGLRLKGNKGFDHHINGFHAKFPSKAWGKVHVSLLRSRTSTDGINTKKVNQTKQRILIL